MRDINKYTYDYNKPNFEDYQVKYRRKKVLEIIDKYKPKFILEIGCGMEPLFKYLAGEYERYTLVEPSKEFYQNAIKLAKDNCKINCYNDFFGSDELVLDEKYDLVVCSGLLHEVSEPLEFIKELYKICSDKTILHINVPNAKSFHRLLAKKMELINDEHAMSERNILYQQHSVFDIEGLKNILEDNGFEIINSGSYFVKPFTHSQMYEMMCKSIIDEKVLDGLYEMTEYMPEMGSEIYVNVRRKI